MTHRQAFTAAVGHAEQEARGRRCRPAGRVLRAILGRTVPALAAAAFLAATAPDLAAQVEVEEPKVTIAAERSSHGFGIDDVVFDLTRSGPKDVAISVQVSLVQADLYLAEGELNRVVEFAADATAAELRIGASLFDGPATESGVLKATLVDASGYRVGRPNSAQTRMLVKDPAITVRPERASYSIDEDGRGGPGHHGAGGAGRLPLRRGGRRGDHRIRGPHRAWRAPARRHVPDAGQFGPHIGHGDCWRRLRSSADQCRLRSRRLHRQGRRLGGAQRGLANDRRRRRGRSRRDRRAVAPAPS